MRVIAKRILRYFWVEYPDSEQGLKTWHAEAERRNQGSVFFCEYFEIEPNGVQYLRQCSRSLYHNYLAAVACDARSWVAENRPASGRTRVASDCG